MYSCGAPFTRPIPACLVLPWSPVECVLLPPVWAEIPQKSTCSRSRGPHRPLTFFPLDFFPLPSSWEQEKKNHTKHKEENSPFQVAAPLQKSLMMGISHETLDVLRSDTVKMRTDTKLLLSAKASFQLPTACYRMLSMPWRSRPYMRTGELTLRSLLPLTSSALVAVR
ncbi:hypothetical protein TsFJ059_006092 [Trichoderma semiorbis]|uniref:Uncharacterized protein n=1 Tax=Trichoderma semiorbis TaxID=1491008 RepID=A0A9P8KQ91_9HYPO|nr:hypothetical protein TsFJ059_006092 [Trichoderma semiorbis]